MATAGERVWTPVELIRWTEGYLRDRGFDDPRLNAELLLAGVLGLRRLDLYLQFDRPLTADELAAYKVVLRRRLRREPLQYIAGTAAFREIVLDVDRRVLIPRPETELLVGEVLAWAARHDAETAIDIGTGSGAIALSLSREGRFRRIVATDVSQAALELAGRNRERVGVANVELRSGSLYEPIAGERFDVIVSNPPYVGETEREQLPEEVVAWEPAEALFSGADGLDVIRELIAGAPGHLRPGGLLALEIGSGQAPAVARLIEASGAFDRYSIGKDLAGHDRIVLAESRGNSATA